jgi:hypothetical protein
VTEVVQPLTAAPVSIESDAVVRHDPSFTELVYAHFAWWQELRRNGDGNAAVAARYRDVRSRFERAHGKLIHSFWCSHVESAVALTERPRRHRWSRHRLGFHRESDWATKDHPLIAAELHRCDELAVRAQAVLTGLRQRICLQLVTASAAHILSLVDDASQHTNGAETEKALQRERGVLDQAEKYYCEAANGQAQIAYFAGMATVGLALSLAAGLALAVNFATPVAALIAGAIGAVVSVVQRINSGSFKTEYDVGRPYAFFLGGLRPLIGAAFALAIYFAFKSGILHLPISATDAKSDDKLGLLVVCFLAGFSERWAQDTLATAVPAASKGARSDPEPS